MRGLNGVPTKRATAGLYGRSSKRIQRCASPSPRETEIMKATGCPAEDPRQISSEARAYGFLTDSLQEVGVPSPTSIYLVGSGASRTSCPMDYDFVLVTERHSSHHNRLVHDLRDAGMGYQGERISARLFSKTSLHAFARQDGLRLHEFQLRNRLLAGQDWISEVRPTISMDNAFVSTAIHILYWTVLAEWRGVPAALSQAKIRSRVLRNVEILNAYGISTDSPKLWSLVSSVRPLSELMAVFSSNASLDDLVPTVRQVLELLPMESSYRGDIYTRAASEIVASKTRVTLGRVR